MRYVFCCTFLIFTQLVAAQAPKYPVLSLPVERNGILLSNAWCGGLDAPEFSMADLNNDGIPDLFIFDRSGNTVLTFLNNGAQSDTAYHWAPQYTHLFPQMNLYAILRDYNHDGIPDIFTNQLGGTSPSGQVIPAGIEVYKGSIVEGNLQFNLVQNCLRYTEDGYTLNLLPSSLAFPSIIDVNNDGDLDILSFGLTGSAVNYWENQTAELGLPADSMIFALYTPCWGNFYVYGTTLELGLNASCLGGGLADNPQPDILRHTGAALWAISGWNNNNVDALLSGAHVDFMPYLHNDGDSGYANIDWADTLWPPCDVPVQLPYFPAAFQMDADNDGVNDLLFAPNFGYPQAAMNVNNVQFYHGVAGDSCGYQYMKDDTFLVHTMMDFGTDSKAVFFDYNGDGLMDIVVGNLFYYNPTVDGVSQLALYQNTGTRTQPRFSQVSLDFAGLSIYGLLALFPAFGDLNGDGKPDMIIGDANGDIDFFENEGDSVASFPSMTSQGYFGINAGAYAAPFIYDVNGDSLPDLLIGRNDGGISYYWNSGTRTNPVFSVDSVDTVFGNINVTLPGAAVGNSQPFMMRDSAGNMLLFVGSDQGIVYEYLVDTNHLRGGTFTLLDSNFLHYNAGSRVTMQAYDLNNDGKLEYLTGNSRGGLQLFSDSLWDSSVILSTHEVPVNNNQAKIFPNPADQKFTFVTGSATLKNPQIELFNLLGQKIKAPYTINYDQVDFSSAILSDGMYLLRIVSAGQIFTEKVLIQHR